MEQKTQFIIDTNGRIFREDSVRQEINPGEELYKAFTHGIFMKHPNFANIPGYGPAHMTYEMDRNIQYWSVPINTINFRTTFRTIKETGELYPSFGHKDQTAEPIMEIEWNKDDAMQSQDSQMHLRFVALIIGGRDGYHVSSHGHFLYAFDGRGVAWRLPVSNLYETCEICMGEYQSTAPTATEVVEKALAQFRKASWNSDLFTTHDSTHQMIRFKPLDKGFQTMPIQTRGWTTLCQKVSTAQLKYIDV